MPENTATICPNCNQPAIKAGNEISCEKCDAIFTITKKDGARVKKTGPIQELEERVERLESLLPGEAPEPESTAGDETDNQGDEESDII